MSLERRLCKLETQIQARRPSWPADVEAAKVRVAARVRLRIGEALNASWHPSVESARALLIGDTPDQAAADLEVLQRWGSTHPEALAPDDGTLTRVMQKLEGMARRLSGAAVDLSQATHRTVTVHGPPIDR